MKYFTRWLKEFLIGLTFISFIITCNFVLFLHAVDFTREQIEQAAPIVLVNVVFLAALFSILDLAYRYFMFERPLQKVEEAITQFVNGNYNYRIPMMKSSKELNSIIIGLNMMAYELSSVEMLKSDFIANVSHEMKTPLAVLLNYCQLIKVETTSTANRNEYVSQMQKQIERLSNLITNVLKLSKIERQQIFLNNQQYNLSEQLCECMIAFEDAWEQKQIEIYTDIEENIFVMSDPELLKMVWDNLLSNAIKFTDNNGRVQLRLFAEDDKAVVEVSDTGCGMSAQTGKHIFQKFYQGDTSRKTEGNGLGLALVKRIIDITGAEITVKSKLNEGSTFVVRLKRMVKKNEE